METGQKRTECHISPTDDQPGPPEWDFCHGLGAVESSTNQPASVDQRAAKRIRLASPIVVDGDVNIPQGRTSTAIPPTRADGFSYPEIRNDLICGSHAHQLALGAQETSTEQTTGAGNNEEIGPVGPSAHTETGPALSPGTIGPDLSDGTRSATLSPATPSSSDLTTPCESDNTLDSAPGAPPPSVATPQPLPITIGLHQGSVTPLIETLAANAQHTALQLSQVLPSTQPIFVRARLQASADQAARLDSHAWQAAVVSSLLRAREHGRGPEPERSNDAEILLTHLRDWEDQQLLFLLYKKRRMMQLVREMFANFEG